MKNNDNKRKLEVIRFLEENKTLLQNYLDWPLDKVAGVENIDDIVLSHYLINYIENTEVQESKRKIDKFLMETKARLQETYGKDYLSELVKRSKIKGDVKKILDLLLEIGLSQKTYNNIKDEYNYLLLGDKYADMRRNPSNADGQAIIDVKNNDDINLIVSKNI